MRYEDYQNRNTDRNYKGPYWNDKEFKKFTTLEDQAKEFVTASIEFQKADFENWKKRNIGINLDHHSQTAKRNITILIAAFLSLLFFGILVYWLGTNPTHQNIKEFNFNNLKKLIENSRGTVLIGIITTFIISPVIYVVWIFRDANNRVQIENSRKDTNLKDFQKLSEWASGFHLPEVKKTINTKDLTKRTGRSLTEKMKETSISTEYFILPDESYSISRRHGAEALQASAIAQLEAFIFGKYGEQFMEPSFLLLHAIWESIINEQKQKNPTPEAFQESLKNLHKNPTFSTLNKVILGFNGYILRLFINKSIGLNLTGLNTLILPLTELRLAGCDLYNVNLSYSNLLEAQLQGASLIKAQFQYAVLDDAQLQKSDLEEADLTSASLQSAKLQFSTLSLANLRHASLMFSFLNHANLELAILEYANLEWSKLYCADLRDANLNHARLNGASFLDSNLAGTSFYQATINQFTKFGQISNAFLINGNEIREDVLSRGAIWDDDPEWLVGKIQDPALLEKIRQDCAQRKNEDNKAPDLS